MSIINLPPFYAAQLVIALRNYRCQTKGWLQDYNKGDVFTVRICKTSPELEHWHVSFVERPVNEYYDATAFAPVDQVSAFESITYQEVIKIESPLISVQ